jgi:hypothetical protein
VNVVWITSACYWNLSSVHTKPCSSRTMSMQRRANSWKIPALFHSMRVCICKQLYRSQVPLAIPMCLCFTAFVFHYANGITFILLAHCWVRVTRLRRFRSRETTWGIHFLPLGSKAVLQKTCSTGSTQHPPDSSCISAPSILGATLLRRSNVVELGNHPSR